MTREESIKRLDEQTFKELAKESCGDCISRQAAINSLGECPMVWTDSDDEITAERDWKDTVEMLKRLPSVIPQPKTEVREKGHWVVDIINGKALYSCSCCLRAITYEWGYHYCPACGAKLEGEEIND